MGRRPKKRAARQSRKRRRTDLGAAPLVSLSADPSKAIGYVRTSTDEQALSPEVQRREIAAYCEARGVELVDVIVERKSGKLSLHQRAGARQVIERVRELGAGVVVVQRRDRIARHVGVARTFVDQVEASGARVRTADGLFDQDTPALRLLATMLDAIAEFEGQLITDRTRAGLVQLRRSGKLAGTAPIGTRGLGAPGQGERDLVTDEDEAAAVRRAVELDREGLSLRRIAAALEGEGHQPRGDRWHAETVRRLLARAKGEG